MSFPFPKNPTNGQVVSHTSSDGTVITATYHANKNEWTAVRQLPKQTIVGSPPIAVHPTDDKQVITWDATANRWVAAAQHIPKLTELEDVNHLVKPALGEMPIWSYPPGHSSTEGKFFFKTPNAHVKSWDSVPEWEAGSVVYHHGELWRAVFENHNVEPTMEAGRVTLFINVTGEPTFGLVPMGLTAGPPASGHQPMPPSKYAYHVDYQNDQQIFIWKWVLKGHDPITHAVYGEWELKSTWTCIVWRGITPPPSKIPPNVVMVWIYGIPTTPHPPVLGQQKWAPLQIDGHLVTCSDVDAANPKHGDHLEYNATTGKWTAIHAVTGADRHPLRVVTSNPIIISDTDYSILLNLDTGTPTVTLPDPTTNAGRQLHFKNYHSTAAISTVNNVRNSKNYEQITNTITAASNGAWSTLVSDGIYWLKLQSYPTTDS